MRRMLVGQQKEQFPQPDGDGTVFWVAQRRLITLPGAVGLVSSIGDHLPGRRLGETSVFARCPDLFWKRGWEGHQEAASDSKAMLPLMFWIAPALFALCMKSDTFCLTATSPC